MNKKVLFSELKTYADSSGSFHRIKYSVTKILSYDSQITLMNRFFLVNQTHETTSSVDRLTKQIILLQRLV